MLRQFLRQFLSGREPGSESPPRFSANLPSFERSGLGRLLSKKIVKRLLLLVAAVGLLRGCLLTYIPPDQLGVRQVSFGSGKGLRPEPVRPGYRREVSGYETIRTFPRNLQVMEFTDSEGEIGAGRSKLPAINVPTVDGYPVNVDVTVLYRIADPYQVVSRFGFGNVYEQAVVLRFTDPLVKRHLGDLLAEEFYSPRRLSKVTELRRDLAGRFQANGMVLVDILVRQYDYPDTFQSLTEQKKLQDQSVLASQELAKQLEVQTRLNKAKAEGEAAIRVTSAEFNAKITELRAEQDLYGRQRRAEGDLMVKTAEAQGTELINRATEGPGSAKLLRLRRGLAVLNGIKGPIYVSGDLTDLSSGGTLAGGPRR